MNILLDNKQRERYKDSIEELFILCPETIAKKIPAANIQQAFMFDTVQKLSTKESKILCVGSFEDTACESLLQLGYRVTQIDPAINMDLNTFYSTQPEKFDIIFSTSVIEHVKDDEVFIDQICKLLKETGFGILTCDFNDSYTVVEKKPIENYRLYTKSDLVGRLHKILIKNKCCLKGEVDYDSPLDFHYAGCDYSFATYMFQKI